VPPNSLEGVVVNAPRQPDTGNVPADRAAAFAAQAARDKEWRDYRQSTPRATDNPNDLSKDFPGIGGAPPPP
jgi:hypothetical protein